jgi:hypothetical protein
MKNVTHICQRQRGFSRELGAFPRPIDCPVPLQTMTLSCSRWTEGRKLKLKVVIDAGQKTN